MAQGTIAQRDFSFGIVRGVGPESIDPRALHDHINGLYFANGDAYARGCSAAHSDALPDPEDHPMNWIWDGHFDAGRRTICATDDDFLVLDSDDEALLNLGSDGLAVPKPSAFLESMLFIGGGYIYGGSRKTATYSTGTVALTKATFDDLGNCTNETAAKTVTGTGTAFSANVDAGMLFQRGDERVYVIDSVDSDTQLTLRDPYDGATGTGISYVAHHFYKITTADPYEDGEFYAVAQNRLLTASRNVLKFTEIQQPHKWTLTAGDPSGEIPNEHEFPEGVRISGAGVIGNTVLVLTTGGIWTVDGIAFDIVDSQGDANHRIQILSRELVAFGQTATWQQALIVPCLSGIFLIDGVSAPRRVSRPVDELWQDYMDRIYQPGQPEVFNDHLILPVITAAGTVKDVLTPRLDRPIKVVGQPAFPYSRQSPAKVACPAFTVRVEESGERKLLAAHRTLSQIIDCSLWWLPDTAPLTEPDGSASQWVLVTRDYETGDLTENTVRFVRPRYELDGDDAEIQVEYGFGLRSEDGPKIGFVQFGGFQFGSSEEEYTGLSCTFGESDGRRPRRCKVNKHTRSIRYRLSCAQGRRRLRLRSIESFVRPSRATRR